jgi:sodium-dependent phosphate transporter
MARLDDYTYVFVIGTFFAMLDAFNNGASEYLSSLRAWTV